MFGVIVANSYLKGWLSIKCELVPLIYFSAKVQTVFNHAMWQHSTKVP